SFSRSAVNDNAGAKTGISSIVTVGFIGLTLLFFTPLFYYLPKPILGAIVIAAVVGLIDFNYVKQLIRLERKDFYVFIATFILTLLLGIKEGVFIGILFSIGYIIFRASLPHYAVLGRLEGTGTYRNIERFPDSITIRDEIFIFRYDSDIFFANAEHFYDSVLEELERFPQAKTVIFDCKAITTVDTTALHKFELLGNVLKRRGISVVLAGMTGPVRDFLHKSFMYVYIGEENMYLTVQDAVDGVIDNTEKSQLSREYSSQTNIKR
ncbi:MAG: STAS domain-containing protein, partial [Bacteroidia bacterium]|nr:STAS domain-containing protein [Bacteroidia bacterium]